MGRIKEQKVLKLASKLVKHSVGNSETTMIGGEGQKGHLPPLVAITH